MGKVGFCPSFLSFDRDVFVWLIMFTLILILFWNNSVSIKRNSNPIKFMKKKKKIPVYDVTDLVAHQ